MSKSIILGSDHAEAIESAKAILADDGVVVVPTETVYGIAVNAESTKALEKLRTIKNREEDKAFPLQIGTVDKLSDWTLMSDGLMKMAKHFWPGPLTLVFDKAKDCSELLTGAQDTIGIRIPQHEFTLALLNACGFALAVPSANPKGETPAVNIEQAQAYFGDQVDLYIGEESQAAAGMASSVIKIDGNTAQVLREGPIDVDAVREFLDE